MSDGKILGLHHVSILVADTTRALAFYEGILGLTRINRPELGFPGAWLNLGDHCDLHLLELPNPDPVTNRPAHGGRDRHFALSVDTLAPFEARLAKAGIAYTRSQSGRQALFCRDPDGNAVELYVDN